jgi:hypothetical protein
VKALMERIKAQDSRARPRFTLSGR